MDEERPVLGNISTVDGLKEWVRSTLPDDAANPDSQRLINWLLLEPVLRDQELRQLIDNALITRRWRLTETVRRLQDADLISCSRSSDDLRSC